MNSKQTPGEAPTVSGSIELQRWLRQSTNPFLRRIGILWAAGVLDKHLAGLTDRQIVQVMFDHLGYDLVIVQSEATNCYQATERLFRSENGSLTEDSAAEDG